MAAVREDGWDLTLPFDQDECCEFLGRLGDRIVKTYPFTMGMEEAYSAIWDRYGAHGTPDAISLLHEILEEVDVAGAGLGLETDIWRTWQRAFRLRNINPHALWIPRVGTRVMPEATPPEIRRIRARNFLVVSSRSATVSDHVPSISDATEPSSSTSNDQKSNATSALNEIHAADSDVPAYAHQRLRTAFQIEDSLAESPQTAAVIEQPDAVEVKCLSLIISRRPTISSVSSSHHLRPQSAQIENSNLDPGVARTWLNLTASQPPTPALKDAQKEQENNHQDPRRVLTLSGEQDRDQILQPIRSEPNVTERPYEQGEILQSLRYRPSLAQVQDSTIETLQPLCYVPDSETASLSHCVQQVAASPSNDLDHSMSESPARAAAANGRARERRHSLGTEVIRGPETVSAGIQYAHRNTTLLAGEIRTPVTPCNNVNDNDGDNPKGDTEAQPVAPKKRKSCKARLLSFLCFGKNKQRAESSESCGCTLKGIPSASCFSFHKPVTTNAPTRPRLMPIANYDGACSPRPSLSSAHLNKPLPLSPTEHQFSALSRANSTSTSPMRRKEFNPPLTASSTDSQSTSASNKEIFRQIAKELLEADMKSAPKLPMNEDGSESPAARLEPRKYEPSQLSPHYNSIALSNPFTDKPVFVSRSSYDDHDDVEQEYDVSEIDEVPPLPTLPAAHYKPMPEFSTPQLPDYHRQMPRRKESPAQNTFEQPRHREHDLTTASRTESSSSPERSVAGTNERRGRSRARTQTPQPEDDSPDKSKQSKTPKRSQSPFKRLLGMGKGTPTKDANAPTLPPTPGSSAKRSLKDWSYKLKHGFLAPDVAEQERENHMEEYNTSKSDIRKQPPSTFPISLDPSYQARLHADLELMILISANRFLMREAQAGRIPQHSIDKFRRNWEANNMPQVIEYQFDMATQRSVIMENIKTVEFCGRVSENPLTLAATLHSWTTMIYEMSIRTFCVGDSVIRKWLNDGQRILEMLGAPYITFSKFDKMSTRALLVINHRQRLAQAEDASEVSDVQTDARTIKHTRNFSDTSYVFRSDGHKRSASNDSYVHGLYGSMAAQLEALDPLPVQTASSAPASNPGASRAIVAEPHPQRWQVVTPSPVRSQSYNHTQTLPRDAYEESRGGRLGLMRNATPAPANNPFSRQSPGRMGY